MTIIKPFYGAFRHLTNSNKTTNSVLSFITGQQIVARQSKPQEVNANTKGALYGRGVQNSTTTFDSYLTTQSFHTQAFRLYIFLKKRQVFNTTTV